MKTTIINKILLVLMLITAQQVSALEFQVDGIYYRTSIFTKNSAYVTHSGTSYTESVEYQGEVVIPESVTYNGKTYTIASIGGYAFAGCPGLTSVTIPSTVTTINQNAFNGCTGLKTIECKATTPPALGDNAFTSYDATLVVPSSSESVYKSAAGWSNFKFKEESSETPGSGNTGGGSGNDNGDDTGGSAVPEVCYLVGNYNGWSVPNIENVDDLYTLTDPDKDGVYYGKFYFNKDEFEFKIFLGIGDWSNGDLILGIEDNTSISMNNISETFTLQDSNSSNIACLGWIGGYVEIFFDFNNKTLRFTIPNENNTLVYKITSSTDVEVIAGADKYKGDIVIPSQVTISGKTYTVTSIANDAFKGCTGLTSITIPSSITSIGSSSFDSCTNLNKVSISDMLSWCKITFGNSLANPLYYAKNLYLNGSLVSKLEIPSAITEIKNYTFYNCTSISTIVFPSGILKIGNSAFVNCSNMTSVTIPNSVTTIDENAFNGCTGLASLTIGSSVGSIGNYAFGNCTGLKSVTSLNSTPPTCGTGVFQGVTISSIPLTVPAGSESLYKATYTWQDFKYKEESENPGDDPAVETSGLKYNIISSTDVEVIGGTEKYTGHIVIPSQTTIEGKAYNVTKIADEAFYACSGLKTITIPNSVTSIGNYVLGNCPNLTSIVVESGNKKYDSRNNCNAIIETSTNSLIAGCKNSVIPSSVTTIGTASFMGCTGLTSITIPSSVVSLGEDAFYECTGLTSMTIPNSVTSIGDNVFAYCSNLKTITLSTNIKTISYSAFLDCYSLTSITVPNSVITIEEEAFCGCDGLADVIIGNSVASIGNHAFLNCGGLTSVTMLNSTPPSCGTDVFKNVNVSNVTLTVPTGSVSVYKSADTWKDFKYEQTEEEPSEPELPTDNSGLSYNIISETEVEVIAATEKYTGDIVIPSQTTIDGKVYSVTGIGNNAFKDCTNLTCITIPNSVTSIGDKAFSCCSGLTSISIPNSVTNIGDYAFYYCTNLTSIEIPNSVTSIDVGAFSYCSGLESIIVESGNTVYDSRNNCNAIIATSTNTLITGCKNTTIPESVTCIDVGAFSYCSGLTSVTIPNSVTSIGVGAFSYCSGLTSVTIGNSVTSIGDYTFSDCSGLKSITIPNSVTSIGDYAFHYCTNLTSIEIPNSVTSIGDYAFYGCSDLTSITIPNSVTNIGDYAFYWCRGLTSVTIGNSVTGIGSYAFAHCSGLTSITSLNPTPPTCGTDVFYNVSVGDITLEVPSESVSLYQSADTWKDFKYANDAIVYSPRITKLWTIPADASTGLCSVRTGNGFGDTFFGSNYQAGIIEEWKDGQLIASYDINGWCAAKGIGETIKVKDKATGEVTEKFVTYVLWTCVMVDDAGNVLANVGTGAGAASACQNWILLPAGDRSAMQHLKFTEFPSADVTAGRLDVPCNIVGNIAEGAYMYVAPSSSSLLAVMYIGLDYDGKIYFDTDNSWAIPAATTFDSSTNVASFQTVDALLDAMEEGEVAADTYIRWRGQGAPFTWNAETSQFEKNTAVPQGTASTPGMDVFKIGEVEYIVVPVKSATTGSRGSSVAVYNLATNEEVASWDSEGNADYYMGSVTARANEDGKSAYIYVAGQKDCFGILKFETEKLASTQNSELSYGAGAASIIEVILIEKDEVEYYTLQGVKVVNPAHGLYIRKQGNKVTKVVL